MYSDRAKRKTGWLVLACALLLLALILALSFGRSDRDISDESAAAIRETVRRSALQCYAVEGVYPSSLEYLEENYGLQVNHEDYYVTYDAFASNMPPTVRVVLRR